MNTELDSPLFLSRLLLNPFSRQVMSEIVHPYEMHRTIMRAFPKIERSAACHPRKELGVLFRCEPVTDKGAVILYVQSRVEPDWSFLEKLNGYLCTQHGRQPVQYKDVMPAYRCIRNGQLLSFHLKANPTKRVARDGDPLKGKRVDLLRESDQVDWLIRKGIGDGTETGGFEIPHELDNVNAEKGSPVKFIRIRNEGKISSRKRKDGNEAVAYDVTLLSVTYEGILRVTDKNRFIKSLIRGIGPGKAYGFGLLSVAPIGVFDH